MMRYRAKELDCDLLKAKAATPNVPARKILRSVHQGARDIALIEEYVTSRRQRKKVELLFAHLKRILKLNRKFICAFKENPCLAEAP